MIEVSEPSYSPSYLFGKTGIECNYEDFHDKEDFNDLLHSVKKSTPCLKNAFIKINGDGEISLVCKMNSKIDIHTYLTYHLYFKKNNEDKLDTKVHIEKFGIIDTPNDYVENASKQRSFSKRS